MNDYIDQLNMKAVELLEQRAKDKEDAKTKVSEVFDRYGTHSRSRGALSVNRNPKLTKY